MIPRGGNKYAFKSDLNKKYLVAEDHYTLNYAIKTRSLDIDTWEEFEVNQTTEGILKIKLFVHALS